MNSKFGSFKRERDNIYRRKGAATPTRTLESVFILGSIPTGICVLTYFDGKFLIVKKCFDIYS